MGLPNTESIRLTWKEHFFRVKFRILPNHLPCETEMACLISSITPGWPILKLNTVCWKPWSLKLSSLRLSTNGTIRKDHAYFARTFETRPLFPGSIIMPSPHILSQEKKKSIRKESAFSASRGQYLPKLGLSLHALNSEKSVPGGRRASREASESLKVHNILAVRA